MIYTQLILDIELLIKKKKHRLLKLQPINNNLNYLFLYAVYKRFNCLHFFSFFKC